MFYDLYRKPYILLALFLFLTSCVKTQLIKEIEKGNIANVKNLVSQGKSVNYRGRDGVTPLMEAARYGRLGVVELLLDNGAKVNQKSRYHWTALMFAIYRGHLDVSRLLIENGSDVNIKTKRVPGSFSTTGGPPASTPLIVAVQKGFFSIVKLLVENGADVNAMEGSAFDEAAKIGHLDMLKFLKKHGADMNSRKGKYRYAMVTAARGGYLDVIKWFVDNGADINTEENRYAINAAAGGGHLDVVMWLFDNGAVLNCCNGNSALLSAAYEYNDPRNIEKKEKYFSVIEFLIQNGADINKVGINGDTALVMVIPDIGIVKYLMENGADPSIINVKKIERGSAFDICRYETKKLEDWIELSKKKGKDIDVFFMEKLNKYREVLKYLESVRGHS